MFEVRIEKTKPGFEIGTRKRIARMLRTIAAQVEESDAGPIVVVDGNRVGFAGFRAAGQTPNAAS